MSILIYGATGFTGRRVAEALVVAGHEVTVAGRDTDRTRALAEVLKVPWRAAPVEDPVALARAVEGAAIVVNCAGPFSQLGEPLLQAALAGGASFADISGEQAYARDIYERYESRARRERRAVVLGLAFEPAVADWAASLAAAQLGPGRVDEVVLGYALSRVPFTPGLINSMRAVLAAPAVVWAHDRWEPAWPAGDQQILGFPDPFGSHLAIPAPLAAVITVPRHTDTAAVRTLVSAGRASPARKLALKLVAAAAPAVARSPLTAEVGALAPTVPTDDELSRASVAVIAEARRGFDRARVAVVGSDPYRITAAIVALGVRALAEREGALAPTELVAPAEALDSLRESAGIHIERDS